MPVRASDLKWYRTDSGGRRSTLVSSAAGGIFPNLSAAQNKAQGTDYRLLAVVNTHPSSTLSDLRVFLSRIDSRGAAVAIALSATGVVAQTAAVGDPNTIPGTFHAPSTEASGLTPGAGVTLPPGFALGVWVRRRAAATSAVTPERNTLTLSGTSSA